MDRPFAETRPFELRAEEKDGRMELYGTPIVFESPTMTAGYNTKGELRQYIEIIDSRALDSCDMGDTALKHLHGDVLARVRNKSLQLISHERGLDMHAFLSDTQKSRDVYTEVRDGLLPEMSFAFPSAKFGTKSAWSKSPDGTPIRRIVHIPKLIDVSTVYNGAYGDTKISARTFDDMDMELEGLDSGLDSHVGIDRERLKTHIYMTRRK